MNNYLILLSGKNGSGKTEMANYLVKKYGFIKLTIVKKLKQQFCDIYNITTNDLKNNKCFFRNEWTFKDLKEINETLYNKVKQVFPDQNGNELNDGLIEYSRNMIEIYGKEYWVKEMFKENKNLLSYDSSFIVVDDWRRIHEYKHLKKNTRKKIITIRINHDQKRMEEMGYKIVDNEFEVELDDYNFNYRIDNLSSLETFYNNIGKLMKEIGIRGTK